MNTAKRNNVYKYGRTISEFVRNLREEMGLSQKEFGKELGVHGQYISNVERGVYGNPLSFCALLYSVVDKDRAIYLTDLVTEIATMRAMDKMISKKKQIKRPRTDEFRTQAE